jgi:hypothetical protein
MNGDDEMKLEIVLVYPLNRSHMSSHSSDARYIRVNSVLLVANTTEAQSRLSGGGGWN